MRPLFAHSDASEYAELALGVVAVGALVLAGGTYVGYIALRTLWRTWRAR